MIERLIIKMKRNEYIKLITFIVAALSTFATYRHYFPPSNPMANIRIADKHIIQATKSGTMEGKNTHYHIAFKELKKAVDIDDDICKVHLNLGLLLWVLQDQNQSPINEHLQDAISCSYAIPHFALFFRVISNLALFFRV